jgi:hypothetical protein
VWLGDIRIKALLAPTGQRARMRRVAYAGMAAGSLLRTGTPCRRARMPACRILSAAAAAEPPRTAVSPEGAQLRRFLTWPMSGRSHSECGARSTPGSLRSLQNLDIQAPPVHVSYELNGRYRRTTEVGHCSIFRKPLVAFTLGQRPVLGRAKRAK